MKSLWRHQLISPDVGPKAVKDQSSIEHGIRRAPPYIFIFDIFLPSWDYRYRNKLHRPYLADRTQNGARRSGHTEKQGGTAA